MAEISEDRKKEIRAGISDLVKRTDKVKPKDEDIQALQEAFEVVPALYRLNGNTQYQTFLSIFNNIMPDSGFFKESTKKYIEEMKTELGYFSPTITFVEKMLIDEIVTRWLWLQGIESTYLRGTKGQHSMKEGLYLEKRLHLSQKRYLQAMETLAKVRKIIAQTQAKGASMLKDLVAAAEQKEDKEG